MSDIDLPWRLRAVYSTHPMVMEAAAEIERLEAARIREMNVRKDFVAEIERLTAHNRELLRMLADAKVVYDLTPLGEKK